jgi:hypothetical protein
VGVIQTLQAYSKRNCNKPTKNEKGEKKKKVKNKKRRNKMKVKGKEIAFPFLCEQYTKLKRVFVTTKDKCHKNTVQYLTYISIVLLCTLMLSL